MLKQRPTLDISCSNWYLVQLQVDKVKSHLIELAMDNIAELNDLQHFEFNAECLALIESLLADNKYLFPVAESVESGVHGPNPTLRELKAADEYQASPLLPGRSNPGVYLH